MFQPTELLGRPCWVLQLIREIIFEVDDDGDGALGWQDFSNLWMRTKKSLRSNDADQPMRLFNLIDFACVDLATHEDGAVGRIPNNKMLELFDRRYGKGGALVAPAFFEKRGRINIGNDCRESGCAGADG